jgi:hypothetical protein
MRYLGLGALASFVAVSFVACSGLRQADPEPDAALPDGEAPPDGAILEDGAVAPLPDGAKPDTSRPDAADTGSTDSPADVACVGAAQDAWSRTTKITPGCADRRVFLLEGWATGGLPYFARALSIARASNGRVGVAVNGETGPEEGTLRIRTFTPTTATFASQLVKIDPLNFEELKRSFQADFSSLLVSGLNPVEPLLVGAPRPVSQILDLAQNAPRANKVAGLQMNGYEK